MNPSLTIPQEIKMPINRTDIKLRQSQRLDDTDFGGGQITINEVVSGEMNNLFPDISRMDRTYGRVSMRKAYLQVDTTDRSTYYGAHAAMTADAKDPNVSVCFFSDKDFFSQRRTALDRMEGYLVRGPMFIGALWESHWKGTNRIRLHCPPNVESPAIGDILILVTYKGTAEEVLQYIRIADLQETIKTYVTAESSSVQKKVLDIKLSSALEYDFEGEPLFGGISGYSSKMKTCIYTSAVADAATYYGVSKLAEDVEAGSMVVRVNDIRTQLLPCTMSTKNVLNVTLDGTTIGTVTNAKNPPEVSKDMTGTLSPNGKIHIGTAIQPGSFTLVKDGATYEDDNGGNLRKGGAAVGVIDYTTGIITFGGNVSQSAGGFRVTYKPAVPSTSPAYSGAIMVGVNNRVYDYVYLCSPVPSAGTLKVSFMSNNKWYVLQDDGKGALKGADESVGAGRLDLSEGSVSLTLGALPDVGSTIIFTWAKDQRILDLSGDTLTLNWNFTLTHNENDVDVVSKGIARGTFRLLWNFTGNSYDDAQSAIVDDGNTFLKVGVRSGSLGNYTWGYIAADGTETETVGRINYSTGEVTIYGLQHIAPPSEMTITRAIYEIGEPIEETITAPNAGPEGRLNIKVSKSPILPGSVEIEWHTVLQKYGNGTSTSNIQVGDKRTVQIGAVDPVHIYTDEVKNNGKGGFRGENSDFSLLDDNQVVAINDRIIKGEELDDIDCPAATPSKLSEIDYTAGTINFAPTRVGFFPVPMYDYRKTGNTWTETTTQQVQTFFGVQDIPTEVIVAEEEFCFVGMEYKLTACTFEVGSNVIVRYRSNGDSATQITTSVPVQYSVVIKPMHTAPLLPGSVSVLINGEHIADNGNGTLYKNIDADLGIGEPCGSINYVTRTLLFTDLSVLKSKQGTTGGYESVQVEIVTASASYDTNPMAYTVFRLPGAPLVPKSVYISATGMPTDDHPLGEELLGNTNEYGRIQAVSSSDGGGMDGVINYNTGVCHVYFGRWIPDTYKTETNPDKIPLWYASAVKRESEVWQPCPVFADSLKFSCTIASYIALDSSILGINPVRLPVDGKVPIFRNGDVVLIHATKEKNLGSLAVNTTVNLDTKNLGDVIIYDKHGRYFPEVTGGAYCPVDRKDKRNYTVDLINGTIKFSSALDYNVYDSPQAGSGQYDTYEGPFRAVYRIEDMCLCTDTQITGHLGLNQAITHDYKTSDNALVSSVLPCGDLQSAAYNEFHQKTWTGEWSNAVIGDEPNAKYRFSEYAIQVENRGAIKERWLIKFNSPTSLDVIGEKSGVLISGLKIDTTKSNPMGIENEGNVVTIDTSGATATAIGGGYIVEGAVEGFVQPGGGWYKIDGEYYLQAVSRLTGIPFWRIAYKGFNTGWAAGNCIRFNTDAAGAPFWFVRTVLQHPATEATDKFQFLMRGDSI